MAFDPITAGINAGKAVLNKLFRDKMSEKELKEITQNFGLAMRDMDLTEVRDFQQFVIQYEGAAKDYTNIKVFGPLLLLIRGSIRPAFTILIGAMDWKFFTNPGANWPEGSLQLLATVNLIVLLFWFGERAVKNTGVVEALMQFFVRAPRGK